MEPFTTAHPVSELFARRFRNRAGGANVQVLPFADFMDLALYDPEVGYYSAARRRVGTSPDTDFFTAGSMSLVFGRLVAGAAAQLLAPEAGEFTFVEIGAEPGSSVLEGCTHPFGDARVIRRGEPLELPPRAVVFSNELFDAQPFARVVFLADRWVELGVALEGACVRWCPLEAFTREVAAAASRFPAAAADGYTIDLPLRAEALLRQLLAGSWSGLLLVFDYGRTWNELCTEHPAGTGRGYRAHRHTDSLLATPGEQDLTCHLCWDWLERAAREAGFAHQGRAGQESFFVNHAASAIADIVADHPSPLARARTQLKQLLHPALMGQRFEVLWAMRPAHTGR